ncbi:MAG: hypothetical protein NC308_06965 [Clostridium sp.]|nr:hypothetical protein [Bacteroides sp.]MCM1198612.1 hypothetical protein [Clostridium sp.]
MRGTGRFRGTAVRALSVSMAFAIAIAGASKVSAQQQERAFIPSELEFSEYTGYGHAAIGADIVSGSFHRPQEGEVGTGIFFNADGDRRVGRFRMKGQFNFRQSFENGVRYASTFNPLRDMPYVIADSTGGDWRKQDYSMWVDISTKIAGPLYAGLAIDLEVGRGAKKVDPRPQATMSRISLAPSLSLKTGNAGILSAGFTYTTSREVSNMILYDSSTPQKLYLLKGLGQYTYEIFSNTERERKYSGDKMGALLGWQYTKGNSSLELKAMYSNGQETVFDIDYNKPHYRGRYITDSYSAEADFGYDGGKWCIDADVEYSGSHGSGREFVQHFDSSPDVNAWVTDSEIPARYVRWQDNAGAEVGVGLVSGGKKIWDFRIATEYSNDRQSYSAMSSSMEISSLEIGGNILRNIFMRTSELALKVSGGYRMNLGNSLQYVPREADDTNICEGLVMADYEILKAGYLHAGCSIGYGFRIHNAGQMWINIYGNLLHSATGMGRYSAALSVGYRF